MINIIQVDSVDHPELTFYKTLRMTTEHLKKRVFVSESEKVVHRLLLSHIEIISILLTPEWFSKFKELIERRKEKITVYLAEKKLMEKIVGFNLHQGIMALAKIPSSKTIEAVLKDSTEPYLFVAIDGLTNSENVGNVVRNCAAFGVNTILVGETSSSPYLRRAVRNSMGAIFKINIIHCQNLYNTLLNLKDHGFKIIGAHPHEERIRVENTNFTENCCIVFGSEGYGISPAILSICNITVSIQMENDIDSFNVASASAVFLYEVYRQRKAKKII